MTGFTVLYGLFTHCMNLKIKNCHLLQTLVVDYWLKLFLIIFQIHVAMLKMGFQEKRRLILTE